MLSLPLWAGLALAGSLGALSRWRLDLAVRGLVSRFFRERARPPEGGRPSGAHREPAVPPLLGIALVNVLGSLLLGMLIGAPTISEGARLLVSTGFLGGFTTFSTAVVDCWTLWRSGRRAASLVLLLGVWACSLLAFFTGLGGVGLLFGSA